MSIKVMLADDHILMRQGIRQLLEFDDSIEIVGEVSNGEQCIDMIYMSNAFNPGCRVASG